MAPKGLTRCYAPNEKGPAESRAFSKREYAFRMNAQAESAFTRAVRRDTLRDAVFL
jgi:hypothetical protein